MPPDEPIAHVQGKDFRLDIWLVDRWSGEPANHEASEHDGLAWVAPAEASRLPLADPRLLVLIEKVLA